MKKTALILIIIAAIVSCNKETPSGGEGGGKAPDTVMAVDLGLSVKWASCNVGASSPEEYGNYFAWGETAPKSEYTYKSYKWSYDETILVTRYCISPEDGYNGFTDGKSTLLPEDDAATVNWGKEWRTPTIENWEELLNNCILEFGRLDGVPGVRLTSTKAGYTENWIFLPSMQIWHPGDGTIPPQAVDDYLSGAYWSSSLRMDYASHARHLSFLYFNNKPSVNLPANDRVFGMPVRPVCK